MIKRILITISIVFIACKESKPNKEVNSEKPTIENVKIEEAKIEKEVQFSIGNDNVYMVLPKNTKALSNEAIKQKYIYEPRRPSKMFLKEDDPSYEFNLNYKVDKENNTLDQIQKLYTKLYESRKIQLLSNEIKSINGKDFLYMKMLMPPQSVNTSPVDEISHFFVSFTKDKILIGNIRYPASKDDKYSSEALESINSIKVK